MATGRASKLWGVAIGALALSGCSAGQTVAPTTGTGIPPITRASTTTQPSSRTTKSTEAGVVTGNVCGQLQESPDGKVTVYLDSYSGAIPKPTARESILRNGRYRFGSVEPGIYQLLGELPHSQVVSTSIWVSAGETSVANLGTCAPTIGLVYKPANAAVVKRFLAKAQEGGNDAFAATYRYLGSQAYGLPGAGLIFVFAQRPHGKGSTFPFEGGDFAYRIRYGDRSIKFVQRVDNDYECLRSSLGSHWSCEGPNRQSVGNAMAVLTFDEQMGLLSDMPMPSNQASTSSAMLAGVKLTCLQYLQPHGGVTWCITANGITAFAASTNIYDVELVKLLPSIPAGSFSLPARPTKWNRYVWPTLP